MSPWETFLIQSTALRGESCVVSLGTRGMWSGWDVRAEGCWVVRGFLGCWTCLRSVEWSLETQVKVTQDWPSFHFCVLLCRSFLLLPGAASFCGVIPESLELPECPKDQTQKEGIQKSEVAQSRDQVCGTMVVWPEAVPSPRPLICGLCCCCSWSWTKNIHLAFNILGPMGPMSLLLGKPELEGGWLSVAKWPHKGTCVSSSLWGRRPGWRGYQRMAQAWFLVLLFYDTEILP